MNKNDNAENTTVRPLARLIARELSQEEVTQVSAGTSGGNSEDCTTGGGLKDTDFVQ